VPDEVRSLLVPACEAECPAYLVVGHLGARFSCILVHVDDTQVILADLAPAHGLALLSGGTPVAVEYQFAGLPHRFETQVEGHHDGEIALHRPAAVHRVQRRRWFRVRPADGATATFRAGSSIRVRPLVDVSGGGVALRLQERDADVESGAELPQVTMALDASGPLVAKGVVRHIIDRPTARGWERVAGIEFEALSDAQRDRLVGWVMQRERALNAKRGRLLTVAPTDTALVIHGPRNRVRIRAVLDISAGGATILRMQDDGDLVPGARLDAAELRLPGRPVQKLDLEVRNLRSLRAGSTVQTLCGVEFLGLDDKALADLESALRQFTPALSRILAK
jgi:c-di-GMP-binding flagellar brake protein YcgR